MSSALEILEAADGNDGLRGNDGYRRAGNDDIQGGAGNDHIFPDAA